MAKLELFPDIGMFSVIDSAESLLFVSTGDKKYGGYKTELLTRDLNAAEMQFLICHKCSGLLRDASILLVKEEQQLLCELCAPEGILTHPMMPSRSMIASLICNCPLKYRGCNWSGKIVEAITHLNSACGCFLISCDNYCDSIISRSQLGSHKEDKCPMRITKCEYCKFNGKANEMNAHINECLEAPIICTNKCKTDLVRKELKNHLQLHCPEAIVPCPYSKFSCDVKLKRCKLESHIRENKEEHLEKGLFATFSKVEQLETKIKNLENENSQLKILVKDLQKSESVVDVVPAWYTKGMSYSRKL